MTLLSLIVFLLLLPLQINGFGLPIPPRNTGSIQTLVLSDPRPVQLLQPSRNTGSIQTLVLSDPRPVPLLQPSRPNPIAITDDPPSSLLFDLLPLLFILPLIGILLGNSGCSVCPVTTTAAPCPAYVGLSQWVYVRDDMSKGLKIMSLGVINHVCNPVIDCPVGMERVVIPGVDSPTSCYAFRQGNVSPVQASQACRNIGAHLADFESAMEFNAVTARIGANVPHLIGYTTAFNEAVNLFVSSLRTGQDIALPSGVAAADGVVGHCVFATVTRNAANVRTMGTTDCLDITNTGYICEADTSTAVAMCP